ncbi:MAG: hypothetical protein COB30_004025 [Ectothiorhodospiraceae bacterium]|nr:hypothetical protein [Ectothiorhodospiraceae bacterium]
MKYAIAIYLVLFSISVNSEESLCKKVESKGEGHWPLDESKFTKKRANSALESLSKLTNNTSMGADFVSVENELMYIKGYLLKQMTDPKDKEMRKEYCSFIENDAYIHH